MKLDTDLADIITSQHITLKEIIDREFPSVWEGMEKTVRRHLCDEVQIQAVKMMCNVAFAHGISRGHVIGYARGIMENLSK